MCSSRTHRHELLLGQPSRDVLDRIAEDGRVEVSGDETDVRRGQDVIQRPERVIRRQGLDVEYVEGRAGDAAVTQDLDEPGSSTIGPRDVLMSLDDGFMARSSAAPTRPFVLWLRTRWIVRMSSARICVFQCDLTRACKRWRCGSFPLHSLQQGPA